MSKVVRVRLAATDRSDEPRLREWLITHCSEDLLSNLRTQYPELVDWQLLDEDREQFAESLASAMNRAPA